MAATKYLDYNGLLYFWGKLKAYFAAKATTLAGYGITDAKIASGTITLGSNTITPIDTVKVNSTALSVSSGDVSIPNASTSAYGCTKLTSATNSTSEALAATAKAVKTAYDLANGKQSPATTLSGYGITDAYTKTEIDTKLTSAMHYKGNVATVADLPSSGNQTGDFYNVTATGENYAWTGSDWDSTGSIVDLAAITNTEIDTVVAS